jgi:hypothetical protein
MNPGVPPLFIAAKILLRWSEGVERLEVERLGE